MNSTSVIPRSQRRERHESRRHHRKICKKLYLTGLRDSSAIGRRFRAPPPNRMTIHRARGDFVLIVCGFPRIPSDATDETPRERSQSQSAGRCAVHSVAGFFRLRRLIITSLHPPLCRTIFTFRTSSDLTQNRSRGLGRVGRRAWRPLFMWNTSADM